MDKLKIRHFRENDANKVYAALGDELVSEDTQNLLISAGVGTTFTITKNGEPAAIIGGHVLWKGCAQVWAVTSPIVYNSGLYYTKMCKILIHKLAEKLKVHRVHCVVDSRISEYIRWIYVLGFKYESTMYKASPDKTDVYIYVKLEDDYVKWTLSCCTRLQRLVDELL